MWIGLNFQFNFFDIIDMFTKVVNLYIDPFLSAWMFLLGHISPHMRNSYPIGPNFMARDNDEHEKNNHVFPLIP